MSSWRRRFDGVEPGDTALATEDTLQDVTPRELVWVLRDLVSRAEANEALTNPNAWIAALNRARMTLAKVSK